MNPQHRTRVLLSCVGGLLLAGAVISYTQLAKATSHADRARAQRDTVEQALREIDTMRGKPELASIDSERSAQLSRHIETIAGQAGIAHIQIERVQHQPPRRINGGPYLRQPTQVLLRQVTLPQLLALLHDLDQTGQTLQLDDLRLIAPHDQLVGDQWRAEFTVSYLVYEPLERREHDAR